MSKVKLRLPQIAELIYKLKHEDNIPFAKIPLTIGEARREILRTVGLPDGHSSSERRGGK